MVTKRGTKSTKPTSKVKSLPVKPLPARHAAGVKGGDAATPKLGLRRAPTAGPNGT